MLAARHFRTPQPCKTYPLLMFPLLFVHRAPAEVLLLVRDEVLQRLGQRMPPEMQLLEAALSAGGSKERLALLQRYAALSPEALPERPEPAALEQMQTEVSSSTPRTSDSGELQDDATAVTSSSGVAEGPWLHCLAADLERAASQVVSDMELMLEVPDRWAAIIKARVGPVDLLGRRACLCSPRSCLGLAVRGDKAEH